MIMIVVTGANGQLGQLVIEGLLEHLPAAEITAAVRGPAKVAAFAARGVQVRTADYDQPETLRTAFDGADRVLLISSNDLHRALPQHTAVVEAVKQSGASLLVYTACCTRTPRPCGRPYRTGRPSR